MQSGPLDYPAGRLLFTWRKRPQLFLPPSVKESRALALAYFLFRHA
jgi:hypothetical protein